jgi:hypothetical protein
MKINLDQEEVRNIIASLSLEDIKMYSGGEYKKWDAQCDNSGAGIDIEYLYTEKGDLKDKFKEKKE